MPVPLIEAEYCLSAGCSPDLLQQTLAGFGLIPPLEAAPVPRPTTTAGGSSGQRGRRHGGRRRANQKPFVPPERPSDAMRAYLRGTAGVDAIRKAIAHSRPNDRLQCVAVGS